MDSGKKNRDVTRALVFVTQLGINMIVPILLCLFVGQWLDKRLGTQYLVIIFIFLGLLAAYRNMYVLMKPMLKGRKEKEDEKFWKSREENQNEHKE